MGPLSFEDQCMVEKECKNCVKFRGDHCLVLSEFYCLARNGRGCFAKETNLLSWKKTLSDMLEHNKNHGGDVKTPWISEELEKLEKQMSSEISQCRYEDEHKSIKRGKSESGRDKTYKRRGKPTTDYGPFPDLNR